MGTGERGMDPYTHVGLSPFSCHENGTQFFYIFSFFDLISLCQHSTHKHSHVWLPSLPILPANQSSQTNTRSLTVTFFFPWAQIPRSICKAFSPPRFLRPLFCYLPFAVCFSYTFCFCTSLYALAFSCFLVNNSSLPFVGFSFAFFGFFKLSKKRVVGILMKESQHEHHIEKGSSFKGLVDFESEKFNWSSMLIYKFERSNTSY